MKVPFYKISGPEIVSGMSGESEEKLRELFKSAGGRAPSIIFIDEIDSIGGKRESAVKDMERRIVAQFLTCMDDLQNIPVIVIGATNQPERLDPAFRRAGRFDHELMMSVPNEAGRIKILNVLTRKIKLSQELDFQNIARNTPGYVGADLCALVKEAAIFAIKRIFSEENTTSNTMDNMKGVANIEYFKNLSIEELNEINVNNEDFEAARKVVEPSGMREGFTTIPDITWEDVGALQDVRAELEKCIIMPIIHPQAFKHLRIRPPAGVLLYGPPGIYIYIYIL